jgi:hypothetical protein
VLKRSPYRAFYESLQGKYVSEKREKIGHKIYDFIAYAWENLEIIKQSEKNFSD